MLTIFRYGTLVDNETRSNNISVYSSFLIGDINKDVISNEEKDKIPMVLYLLKGTLMQTTGKCSDLPHFLENKTTLSIISIFYMFFCLFEVAM